MSQNYRYTRAISTQKMPEFPLVTKHPTKQIKVSQYQESWNAEYEAEFKLDSGKLVMVFKTNAVDFLSVDTYFYDSDGCRGIYNPTVICTKFYHGYLMNPETQCMEFTADNIDMLIEQALDMYERHETAKVFPLSEQDYLDCIKYKNMEYICSHKDCKTRLW